MFVRIEGRRSSIFALASLAAAAQAHAADITVTNQSQFDAAIAVATQPGHVDTINVDVVDTSSGPALMLPAAATSIIVNFNGVVGGPAVYNPAFDVGYGTTDGGLSMGSGTTLNFNTTNGIASLRVGMFDGTNAGTGTINMTGGTINGLPTGPANYFTLNVGRGSLDSSGTFNQSGGSVNMNGGALQIGVARATGVYDMSGNATLDMGAGTLYLGEAAGGNGTLYIHDSAQFLLNAGTPAPGNGQVYVGSDGGTGAIIQDGADSRVVLNAQNGTHFGFGGGTGEYDISAGQLVFGGLASGSAGLTLGDDVGGTGIVNQTGGVVTLNTGQIHFGAGTGTYNLDGGTLQIGVANPFSINGSGTHEFNLAGGTIQALTSFSSSLDFNLSNVSTIDTFDGTTNHTVTLSGPLSGNGGLIKAGEGILIFNAANTYTGGTEIADGTLQLGAAGSLASTGALQVDTGAIFNINSHTQEVGSLSGGGTIDATTGALVAGGNNANTAFSGAMNGTFAKTGSGALIVNGATFSGGSFIFQGTIAQTGGTTSFNTLAIGEGVGGTGTLAVSGGTLTFGDALQVGDFGGQGAVNQTGGTVQIGSSLNIGNQGGTGTYNISSGDLELTALLNSVGRNGGTASGTGTLNIGGDGLVNVGNGIDPSRLILGYNSGSDPSHGTINQSGGTLRINDGSTLNLAGQNGSTGVYNLDGGALEIGGDSLQAAYMNPAPNYQFNLGGGTIRVIGSALDTDVSATLVGGLSTIDTNGFGASFNGVLSGPGALEKTGGGTLIFNSANTYTGGTEIAAGTLQLGAGGNLASGGALQIDAAGTFDLNGHTQTVGDFAGAGAVLLGDGQLTAGTANDTLFSGSISGSGGVVKQGSGTLALTGSSTYTGDTIVNGGRLAVDGSLVSDVFVNGGTLAGNGSVGSVSVANGATVAPGNLGTLNTASITFAPSSIYQVEINPAGQSDKILASGTATINGGTVQVLPQAGNYIPGTTYTLLTAAGGVSGTFSDVTSNFAFLDPRLVYDPTNVFLSLERNGVTFASLGTTPNQRAVGGALDKFPTSNALLLDVLDQTASGARQAFDALSGELHATVSGVLVQDSRFVRDAILGRLVQASYAGGPDQNVALATGGPTSIAARDMNGRMALGFGTDADNGAFLPYPGHGLTFWTRGFGSWGTIDGDGNAAGARRDLGGSISGVDAGLGDGWRAGLATGYTHSDIAVDARDSSAQIDSCILAGYAGGTYGPFALRPGAAWTWHSVDSSRAVMFPGFSESERTNYNGDTGQIFGEIAYPILTHGSAFEPFAGLGYVHVSTGGFAESGSTAALTSAGSDQDVGYSTLGIRAATTTSVAGYTVTPHTSLAWQYAFGDITPEQSFSFASTNIAFGISGAPIARNSALVEAGLDIGFAPDATFSLSYVGQLADDVTDNGVQGRLNWRF